jgi:hypothetical protein
MKSLTCCLALILATWVAPACLQVTGTTYQGQRTVTSSMSPARLLRRSVEANKHEDGVEMEAQLRG